MDVPQGLKYLHWLRVTLERPYKKPSQTFLSTTCQGSLISTVTGDLILTSIISVQLKITTGGIELSYDTNELDQ